jgi:hypothetical protein
MYSAISLLSEQTHQFLESTIADVTPEQAHWIPPGNAHPIGATYVHAIMAEDIVINIALKGERRSLLLPGPVKQASANLCLCRDQTGKSMHNGPGAYKLICQGCEHISRLSTLLPMTTCLRSLPKILTGRLISPTLG